MTNWNQDFSTCQDVSFWTVEIESLNWNNVENLDLRILRMSKHHFYNVKTLSTVKMTCFEVFEL